MLIHQENKGFIHIPKCGGISVSKTIAEHYYSLENNPKRQILHRSWQGRLNADFVREDYPKVAGYPIRKFSYNNIHATYDQLAVQYPDYEYFTQIRHPLKRWESLYKHNYNYNFIIDWDFVTWSEKAISSLMNGAYYGTVQNLDYFEKSEVRLGSYHIMYLPAWVYYREPEVKVYKLEEGGCMKAMGFPVRHLHNSNRTIPPYDENYVTELIYEFYKKDFERWQMTE